MWKRIGKVRMRTGEIMEIRVVKTPDARYEQPILSFLTNLNKLWRWHLKLAIRGETDELEARFYLGVVKDRIISNVSSWEYGSIGLLAHVLTAEDYREGGACTAVMKAQMKDFRDRGGRILIGGFRPTSYRIAKRLGFKSVIDESEVMRCDLDSSFEKEYFQQGTFPTGRLCGRTGQE
jgi:hypothetical protein